MDPHSRTPKKNTSHGNEVLPQDTTHLIQRPCYQRGSPCQDPAGNWTTRRPPNDRKETQTAAVWLCFLFIRFDQNYLAKHSERGKKTRQTEEEVGRQHHGMDRPGSCFPFIRSGQNHLVRHSERRKKTRQTEEEVGRQHQGMDRPGVQQVPEGSGEQGKMEKTGCEIICGAPTTLAVKGFMMMMMMMNPDCHGTPIRSVDHRQSESGRVQSAHGIKTVAFWRSTCS